MRAKLFLILGVFALSACGSGNSPVPLAGTNALQSFNRAMPGTPSVLAPLKIVTVGSTVDPVTGDVNPYGLAIAQSTWGSIHTGDIVDCDFNDKANVQGTGTAMVLLNSKPGSKPRHFFSSGAIKGCDAIALSPDDTVWPTDYSANNAPIISSSGKLLTTEKNAVWHGPWGIAFSSNQSVPAFYATNAKTGELVRIDLTHGTFTVIVSGFPVNGGKPGSILAPSGLNYVASGDLLYVVDGDNNALYAIDNVSTVQDHGITVDGLTFSGPNAADAHVVFHGKPLNGPISSALLPGGNIALGNTLDPQGKNLIVELTPAGKVVAVKNVDTGAPGAIFGMAATGTTPQNAKLYFNDDNDNTVKVLTP